MLTVSLNYEEVLMRARHLPIAGKRIYGVPNGGIYAALLAKVKNPSACLVEDPGHAECFIDDIVDSGATRLRYQQNYPGRPFYALVDKTDGDSHWLGKWVVFPWEAQQDQAGPEENVRRLLEYIGEDVNREGLKETPRRVIKAYHELFSGYRQQPSEVFTCFEDGACDEMVLLKGIELTSTCEHHMLPFLGEAHIAYVPDGKIIGVSKLARLLDIYARRLQVQERLTTQVTQALDNYLQPKGSACVIEARHMCMVCRGVRKQHSVMVTSSLTGVFRDEPAARSEFFNLIRGN